MDQKDSFVYTYSAKEQQEIERIRSKYLPREEDKMEQLRRLHHSASKKAQSAAITLGVIGALIMGTGMSICMTELSTFFGEPALLIGIAVGVVGMTLVALAYPVYNRTLRKVRQQIAPEILRLTDELLK